MGRERKRECGFKACNTLYGHSVNTELISEAYRTLYPQYVPASSLGLEDWTIWRGDTTKKQKRK